MWSKKSVTKVTKGEEESEEEFLDESESKQGLWDNIRKKKKREGKDYKPAKPGDKDRPKKDAYEKAQKPKKDKSKAEKDDKKDDKKEEKLTDKQKKLPDAIKKSILDKKKKSKADEKAGYPPECNEGYVEKDGKCVPVSDSGYKDKKK